MMRDEPILVHNIAMKFIEGNHCKGHCVVTDNLLTNTEFFEELLTGRIYATGTV